MTLTERIYQRCAVVNCPCDRLEGSLVCGSLGRGHLGDLYGGRLVRIPEGFVEREALTGRAPVIPEWRRRSLVKDFSGSAA